MLQVALDLLRAEDAVRIASYLLDYPLRLEAGTPLIKSEGVKVLRMLSAFGKPLVADLKTMDTGYLEVEMAATNGADLVTVLAVAPDETISSAVDAGKDYGVEIMADLIGVKDIVSRTDEVQKLGVDEILVHVGIDLQKKGKTPLEYVKMVRPVSKRRLAVAGGLNPEKISDIKDAANVFVVGGFITRAPDPRKAVEEILKVIEWV